MRSITTDLTTGLTCSLCGIAFEREHGFPVYCGPCWDGSAPYERRVFARATWREL